MSRREQSLPPSDRSADKLNCFEGLRGLASLAVLAGHLIIAFWPILYSVNHPLLSNYPTVAQWVATTPARALIDGQLAVSIFFLLSGFVLSLSFFKSGSYETLASGAIRRYFRLMIPAAFSIVVAYAVLKTGLMYNKAAANYMTETVGLPHQWLLFFYDFPPNWKKALRECCWDTFFGQTALYNQNLWTMSIEYAGSFLVYSFLALFGSLRFRSLCYLFVGACLILNNRLFMLDFMLGMMLCDLFVANQSVRRKFWLPAPVALLLAFAALYINYMKEAGPYQLWFVSIEKRYCYETAAGFVLVGTMAFSHTMQKLFSRRLFIFLGKISFALYLIHLVAICSLACWLYLVLRQQFHLSHSWAAGMASLACIGASMSISWFMFLYVDRPAIAIGKFVYQRIFVKKKPVGPAGGKSGEADIPASIPLPKAA